MPLLLVFTEPEEPTMLFGREPVLISEAIAALIAVAVAFGLNWTGEQVALINAAVLAVLGVIVRRNVTPAEDPWLTEDQLDTAHANLLARKGAS